MYIIRILCIIYMFIISLRAQSFRRQVDADHGGKDGDGDDVSAGGLSYIIVVSRNYQNTCIYVKIMCVLYTKRAMPRGTRRHGDPVLVYRQIK